MVTYFNKNVCVELFRVEQYVCKIQMIDSSKLLIFSIKKVNLVFFFNNKSLQVKYIFFKGL